MKTLYTLATALFLILAASKTNAQDIQFGPRAGLNLTTFFGPDTQTEDNLKIGFHIGGFARTDFKEKFSFQPEILFSTKGASKNFGSDKYRATFYYLDIPLLAGYEFMDNVRVLAGLQPSIYLGGREKFKGPNDYKKIRNPEDVRRFDLGIIAGAEYALENKFNFGLRFGFGMISVYSIKDVGIYNLNIQATAGYTFGK